MSSGSNLGPRQLPMHIIGILGGVASGKSTVAGYLAELGAGVLEADRAGHEILRLPQVEAAARQRWGETIFTGEGHIDRTRLARIVFDPSPAGPPERKFLEQLTHPAIRQLLLEKARQMEAQGRPAAVLDVPLLLEVGWREMCDCLVFVDAPADLRQARACGRGWSAAEFAARQAAQSAVDDKRQAADVVIDNAGSPEQTRRQVEEFWNRLMTRPG